MITNAVTYSPKADTVDVIILRKESFAILRVRDYGIGIMPAQQEKIFDRFYQADERPVLLPDLD